MSSAKYSPYKLLRSGVAAPESKPSGAAAGINFGSDEGGDRDEVGWSFTAASEADVASVQFWYYNPVEDDWTKGRAPTDLLSITGSTSSLGYTLGERVDVQLTAVTGTFSVYAKSLTKSA